MTTTDHNNDDHEMQNEQVDTMDIQHEKLGHVKLENADLVIDEEHASTVPTEATAAAAATTPKHALYPHLEDVTAALISPGLSRQVLNNKQKREKICQSLDVKSRQQDIIQRRLQASPETYEEQHRQTQPRRMPRKLSLDYSARYLSPHTAPLHGGFAVSMTPIHGRPRQSSRPSPYETPQHYQYVHSPGPRQVYFHAPPRTGVPQSADMRRSPVMLPSMNPALRHPITPPSEQPEDGLDTLSKAARLKVMKEDYLAACGASFDALHGIMS